MANKCMPQILEQDVFEALKQKFSALHDDITLLYTPKKGGTEDEVGALLSDFTELSSRIKVLTPIWGSAEAQALGIVDGPAIVFKGNLVKGDARYYGTPAGYEFGMLVEVIMLAGGAVQMGGPVAKFVESLNRPLKLEVFVTNNCPFCPTSAYVALKLAMLSPHVRGYVYNAPEFPEVSRKYSVHGVPKTVINDGAGEYMGGYGEDVAILNIKKAIQAN